MKINPTTLISALAPVSGMITRILVAIPFMDKPVKYSNRLFGQMLPNMTFLGFKSEPSHENALWNWNVFLKLIGAEYSMTEEPDGQVIYTINSCPAGHCKTSHKKACMATMEIDHSLVERSGAFLVVDKRYPDDGICVERIVAVN